MSGLARAVRRLQVEEHTEVHEVGNMGLANWEAAL